jgi:hypothetical protein
LIERSSPVGVYVDTNVLKFSAHHHAVYRGKPQNIKWGPIEESVTVYELVETDELSSWKSAEQRNQGRTLRLIADASRCEKLRLLMNSETQIESWGLPGLHSAEGVFFGAEIVDAPAPFQFSRVIASVHRNMKNLQFDFLKTIQHKRFLELQKITGAFQGERGTNRNQLLDAFHLWCAEYNSCHYFLTMDLKLAKAVENSKRSFGVPIVTPIQLADELELFHPDFPRP